MAGAFGGAQRSAAYRGAGTWRLGFNVVSLGALTIVTAIVDMTPPDVADTLADASQTLANLSTLRIWIGALGFLPWLKATYERARVLAPSLELEEQWRIGPVASFFIPILNLLRPYRAVRVLDEASMKGAAR